MPMENLNLQIIIPKINEVDIYQNALKNISENTKEIEIALKSREMNDSFKKVHSNNNVGNNDMLTIDNNQKRGKNGYHRKNKANESKHIIDDGIFNGIGGNINIMV